MNFPELFQDATGHPPYPYQIRLACGDEAAVERPETLTNGTDCASKLIDVPTGLGKTAAVVMAWVWNRVIQKQDAWPRRLVYCLPMRTLVEQTVAEGTKWIAALGLSESVGIHVLMGGKDIGDWDIWPEKDAILIGMR